MFGLETLLMSAATAFIPALTDGAKALINKVTGGAGARPSNFGEFLQLQDKEIERLKTLAEIDKPVGDISRWVNDLRSSTRYIMAIIILAVWASVMLISIWTPVQDDIIGLVSQLASMVFFYLYGDRAYTYIKTRGTT